MHRIPEYPSGHVGEGKLLPGVQLISDMGFRYGTYLWDPAYKGLDDYIWEYLFRKKQSK